MRIMQFPGYVVILLEMAHEARIIPTTRRPRSTVRSGSTRASRRALGRQHAGGRDDELQREDRDDQSRRSRVSGPDAVDAEPAVHRALHAHGPDTIDYEMTVEDPEMLTTGSGRRRFR